MNTKQTSKKYANGKTATSMNPLLKHLVDTNRQAVSSLNSPIEADNFGSSVKQFYRQLDAHDKLGIVCGVLFVALWTIVLFGG